MASQIGSDLNVTGHLTTSTITLPSSCVTDANVSSIAAIARSKLAQDTSQPFGIDLLTARIWDAPTSFLSTPGADDLGHPAALTFGTYTPTIITSDSKAASTTQYARLFYPVPIEWDTGETVQLAAYCGMDTTIADTSATIDFQVYASDGAGGVTADLVATAAQSMNSLTFATKTFNVTSSGLAAGTMLDIRVAIVIVDGATATAVTGVLGKLDLLCDVKG